MRRVLRAATVLAVAAFSGPLAIAQGSGRVASPAARAPSIAPAYTRAQVEALLGPLRLMRPLAPDTLQRLIDEGESVYRARHAAQAHEAFATVVELDPHNVHAWLRLGNLHQQAGREIDALAAYRHAGAGHAATARDETSRGKALLNIALLGVAQAEHALEDFDRDHDTDDGEDDPSGLAAARAEALVRIERLLERVRPAPAMPAASMPTWPRAANPRRDAPIDTTRDAPSSWLAPRQSPAAGGPASHAAGRSAEAAPPRAPVDAGPDRSSFEPYTVDRWTGRARRGVGRVPTARSALVEPISESPQPALAPIEVLRGQPSGRTRP